MTVNKKNFLAPENFNHPGIVSIHAAAETDFVKSADKTGNFPILFMSLTAT